MSSVRVLVTDYAWPNLERERSVLASMGATLVVAEAGDEAELRRLAVDVDAILTCWGPVSRSVLDAAGRCLTVARYGVGLDNIDVVRATQLGMVVTNVPDYCSDEVADHTMALTLGLLRRICILDRDVRSGGWDNRVGGPPPRISDVTLGLVGFGRVGRAVAARARAHRMTVKAWGRSGFGLPDDVQMVDLPELLATSDVVSIHVPLTPEMSGLIGREELALMKPGAYLVNTSRGGLIDTDALVRALEDGPLAGAALDVTEQEPLPEDHPLRSRPDVIVTPHSAFYSGGSVGELAERTAQNAVAVLRGEVPDNVCNREVLDSPLLRMRVAR